MPDILVTENIVGSPMKSLRADFAVAFEPDLWKNPARLSDTVGQVRALMVRNQTHVTAELIARASQLEIIARAGA
ncbi:hypothetical protein FJY63_08560, partial [Candidatus Sumerlaeota bacterium]|nr:hypothetical protein [Candidatus Sumerlaeota bacterium]